MDTFAVSISLILFVKNQMYKEVNQFHTLKEDRKGEGNLIRLELRKPLTRRPTP
jgi:hypothetical protein